MNKYIYGLLGASLVLGISSHMVMAQQGATSNKPPVAPTAPTAPHAVAPAVTAPVAAPPAAVAVPVQPQPLVQQPQQAQIQTQAQQPVMQQPVASGAPLAAVQQPTAVGADQQVQDSLRDKTINSFKGKLSFPLDEQKMIMFAAAAARVNRINTKWDVQISSADSDSTAIEYNNFAVEEITKSLKTIPDLTLDQYNEMTRLTSTDPEFNHVYLAYRQLIQDGKIKPNLPVVESILPGKKAPAAKVEPQPNSAAQKISPTGVSPVQSAPAAVAKPVPPVVKAPVAPTSPASSAAVPAGSGSASAPQGSLAIPYSPPVSR